MADERRIHASLAEPVLLERQNAAERIHVASDRLHPALPPGPHGRRDVGHHPNALLSQLLREPEIEIGRIDQQRHVRPRPPGEVGDLPKDRENPPQLREHFADAHHGELAHIPESLGSRPPAVFASEPRHLQTRLQLGERPQHAPGEQVAGGLAAGHQHPGHGRSAAETPITTRSHGPPARASGHGRPAASRRLPLPEPAPWSPRTSSPCAIPLPAGRIGRPAPA